LLKYTPVEHPDYRGVQMSLNKMKNICNATNEAKRRWEKLEEIAEWQNTIEGWEVRSSVYQISYKSDCVNLCAKF